MYWVYELWNSQKYARKSFQLEDESIEYADKMKWQWKQEGAPFERHYQVYYFATKVYEN